jgi:diaminohydroxyphosphoribosylaminopyrimidine deaminase / 5-amino-6-(5-phosphoribosylamino)uracil reductase
MPPEPLHEDHNHWMSRCLELARRGAGHVSPNPMVGAVVVDAGGRLLGEGWHERYGGPHAEPNAVHMAEERHGAEALRDATLYVNLEPCSHFGKTPPCADLILEKRIPRVVAGMVDPSPKVAGQGIARLREHGVDITVGVLEQACRRLNEAFVHHVQTGRPLVTLKIAQTLDGRIATRSGDSKWISGEVSRRLVHRWRAELDGVLVGAGTAAADDPALTVRMVDGRQPVRVVLDRNGSLPPHLKLFSDGLAAETVAIVGEGTRPAYAEMLLAIGGRILDAPERDGHLDLLPVLERLGREGGRSGRPMQSLLVEAGLGLASALIRQDLADRLFLFTAPKVLGEGLPGISFPGPERMADALSFTESAWEQVGEDMLFRGYRRGI